MDPSGDCDNQLDPCRYTQNSHPWKSSVDPSGDYDNILTNLDAVDNTLWKSSVDPSGDCDRSALTT